MMNKDFLYQDLKTMWEQLAEKFIGDFPGAVPVVLYWVMCTNPDCEHKWQMDRKDYIMYLKENQDPMSMMAPAIVCPSCGEEGGYRAEKCEKCGLIFIRGSVPQDFADRCPECSHSKTEKLRKETRKKNK